MSALVRSSLDAAGLAAYAAAQVNGMFPDPAPVKADDLRSAVDVALARLEHCFSHVDNRYFFDGSHVVFNHLHGDQYAIWLYFLANELHRQGGPAATCSKLFLLNKALHGLDAFYEVELPSVFLVVHPLGTVLGRGRYSDFFIAYQRCGIGANHDVYPTLGRHVTLRPGSAVLGRSVIGDYCQMAAESLVLDRDLPDNTLYIGNPSTMKLRRQEGALPIWRVQGL
jgi:serine O-acetyltransferase